MFEIWENPSSISLSKLINDVRAALRGRFEKKVEYSFERSKL
jgi:hypothetical protein